MDTPSSIERSRTAPPVPPHAQDDCESSPSVAFAWLIEKLHYLEAADQKRVREAYKFADEAHLGQMRASGAPYITHPIAVATICSQWKLDAQALMAALMHDTMEDCGITKAELVERFGAPVAELVDGLTKLDKIQFSTKEESQAESFRKMLLAMARDVRVILIKLADRLHNMRTMNAMAPHKRVRIARETLEIYAPIAHRLGLNEVYRELQDLAFQNAKPWRYGALRKAIQHNRQSRRELVSRVRSDLDRALGEFGIRADIYSREKTLLSIFNKMREKHLSFAQVSDIFGFRIVVPRLQDCYLALGALHQLYKPQPGRFKDYIAIPKPNGYQSIHTTLIGPVGTPIEFQIRTEAMHQVAEFGIAAHWLYKAHEDKSLDPKALSSKWLQSLLDIQDETRDAAEFLEHVKVDLFPDAVYVFTPKSRILALPRGATPVDFAYAIHSDVGDHCVACKVNGEPVPLRTVLRNGDSIEIITAESARPNPAWLNFAHTGRARSKIRHFLKTMAQEESVNLGQRLLSYALRAEGFALPADDSHQEGSLWLLLARWAGTRHAKELLIELGQGRKIATIVAKRMASMLLDRGEKPDAVMLSMGRFLTADDSPSPSIVTIDGSEGPMVHLSGCCRPVPGDPIVGYLGRGEGLVVHTTECSVGRRRYQKDSEHWMQVEWSDQPTRLFDSALIVTVNNHKGALARVAQAISQCEADINHIDMNEERGAETAEMRLTISVRDRVHLAQVLKSLKRSPIVIRAGRVKP